MNEPMLLRAAAHRAQVKYVANVSGFKLAIRYGFLLRRNTSVIQFGRMLIRHRPASPSSRISLQISVYANRVEAR